MNFGANSPYERDNAGRMYRPAGYVPANLLGQMPEFYPNGTVPIHPGNLRNMHIYSRYLEAQLADKRRRDAEEATRFRGLQRKAFLLRRNAENAAAEYRIGQINAVVDMLEDQ